MRAGAAGSAGRVPQDPGAEAVGEWAPGAIGGRLDFWGVAEAGNVTLSTLSVTAWADLGAAGNDATAPGGVEPQWEATGWSDGSPCITFDGGDYMQLVALASSTGNDYFVAAAINPTNVAVGGQMLYAISGSGVPAVMERTGAYAIYDAAYKAVGTATTGEQSLVYICDSAATVKGRVIKNGTDLGALTPSDYDGTMPTAATPTIGGLPAGTSLARMKLKAIVIGRGRLHDLEVDSLVQYVGSFL